MKIVAAANTFKGALRSVSVCEAITSGLRKAMPGARLVTFPVADGGDHTSEVFHYHFGGQVVKYDDVSGPLGAALQSGLTISSDKETAYLDLAEASGIRHLKASEYDPFKTTTYGTGQLIRRAIEQGARQLYLGVGGSATVDGGTGILTALGFRFLDHAGKEVPPGAAGLDKIEEVTFPGEDIFSGIRIHVLCDVTNPLTGERGAAPVFGPQKGADNEDISRLDHSLRHFARIALKTTGKDISSLPYGGAAGGVAAGLHAFLNAELLPGASHILDVTGFDKALENADLVITGEGRLDEQTLQGKAPFEIAARCKKYGIPVVAFTGKAEGDMCKLNKVFTSILPIGNGASSLQEALSATEKDLQFNARQVGLMLNAVKK